MIIDKLSGSRVTFEITVTKDQFEHGLDHAFEVVNKDTEIKGFRKGQAPRNVFEKKYGVESLYEEAINHVLQETYYNAVIENNIEVVAQPKIDLDPEKIVRGKDFTYKVTVAVKPEVKLGEYLGLEVSIIKPAVSEEEVNQEVSRKLEQHAEMVVKEEGTLENGNTAVFDFSGSVDGEKFEGGTAENYELVIGSGNFIPGFEEQMVGMASEEEKDVVVTFPENYQEKSLAGKEAVFACKLHEIKERVVPELNEEFITELNEEDVKTVEDYRAKLEKELLATKENQNQQHIRTTVINKAIENAEFEIPEEMILEETNRSLETSKNQIKQYGLDWPTYLQYMGKTEEALVEELKAQSLKTLSEQLVIEAIGNQEKLEVTKEEIEKKYDDIVEQYKAQNVTLEQAKQAIPESAITQELVYGKAIELILDKAVVNE
ncbi:trigger factor [Candidatus Izemoplasma sp. B36]|uniref:trigger factor n=1 Tax=Candidatus Izemoplasma sp. B36 TaxID=3242468 RepID=UPI00355759CE